MLVIISRWKENPFLRCDFNAVNKDFNEDREGMAAIITSDHHQITYSVVNIISIFL